MLPSTVLFQSKSPKGENFDSLRLMAKGKEVIFGGNLGAHRLAGHLCILHTMSRVGFVRKDMGTSNEELFPDIVSHVNPPSKELGANPAS